MEIIILYQYSMKLFFQVVLLAYTAIIAQSVSVTPTWIPSSLFKADKVNVISSLTGAGSTPSYSFTFSSPFTSLPTLSYGISSYKGYDYLRQQKFHIERTGLTLTTFDVEVQIIGITSVYILGVSYIAIDASFPYHLNGFDDVPANFSDGALTIFATTSPNQLTYTNTIDYSVQAASQTYNSFSQPLASNKICLFITSMQIQGDSLATPDLYLTADAEVISTTQYTITVVLNGQTVVQKLHYSMLIFDTYHVQGSGEYVLHYQRIQTSYSGVLIPIPSQFAQNLILGWTQFSTYITETIINFRWNFQIGEFQGIEVPSIASNQQFVDSIGWTLFYLKTYDCPDDYYFNPNTDMCVMCDQPFCMICGTLACDQCIYGYELIGENCLNACGNGNVDTIFSQECDDGNNLNNDGCDDKCRNQCPQDEYRIYPSTDCLDCTSAIANCHLCNNPDFCLECDYNYYYDNATQLCELLPCADSNCAACVTDYTVCQSCDPFFQVISGSCHEICGDSNIIGDEECDDGNANSNDGCSSSCRVEQHFSCAFDAAASRSICQFIGQISNEIIYIEKVDGENQLNILLQFSAYQYAFYEQINWNSMVSLRNVQGIDSYSITVDDNGNILIKIKYSQDIHSEELSIEFDLHNSQAEALQSRSLMRTSVTLVPTDNEGAYFYQESTYNLANVISIMGYSLCGLAWLSFFVGLFNRKMIGVQMMAVLQICYFYIISLKALNPSFKALSSLQFINGYDLLDRQTYLFEGQVLPNNPRGIYLVSQYLLNFNISAGLFLLPPLVSLIALVLQKTVFKRNKNRSKKANLIKQRAIGEYMLTVICLFGYVTAVCFGIQVQYGAKNFQGSIAIISLLQAILIFLLSIVYFILLILRPKWFGQYIQEMQDSPISNKAYNYFIVQRFVLGMLLSTLFSFKFILLIPMFIFFIQAIYLVLKKPYRRQYNNWRQFGNCVVCILVGIIFLVYSVSGTDFQNKQKIAFYLPIIILCLLIIAVIGNTSVQIYEIVKNCKKGDKEDDIKGFNSIKNLTEDHQQSLKMQIQLFSMIKTNRTTPSIKPFSTVGVPSSQRSALHEHLSSSIKQDFINEKKRLMPMDAIQWADYEGI